MHESIPAREDRIIRARQALIDRLFALVDAEARALLAGGAHRVWLVCWPAPAAAVVRVEHRDGSHRLMRRLTGDELATLAATVADFLATFGDDRWPRSLVARPKLDRVIVFDPLVAQICA